MADEVQFVKLAALICEPSRAKMLWSLLDGKAYTASELAMLADLSFTSASNHLSKLLEAGLLTVSSQGRHRYFSFAKPEVAYAVEALANLTDQRTKLVAGNTAHSGIKYCRTCYDHLAGFVGVTITEALVNKKFLVEEEKGYLVTAKGWNSFADMGIVKEDVFRNRRPVARQCLDWSERRHHLAGQLGTLLLNKMMQKKWFKRIAHSREMLVTPTGQKELYDLLRIEV